MAELGRDGAGAAGRLWSVVAVSFLASTGFSILLPSLWLRLQHLGQSKTFYGVVVAAYSVGQFPGSIAQGHAIGRAGFRAVFVGSLLLEALMYALYAAVNDPWLILAARLVAGFAAGNISVARAFVAVSTDTEQRTSAMGYLTSAQAMGYVVGPSAAAALGDVSCSLGPLRLNAFNSPALLAALLCLLNVALVAVYFAGEAGAPPAPAPRPSSGSTDPQPPAAKAKQVRGIPFLLWTQFLLFVVFSLGETVMTPLGDAYFGWNTTQLGVLWAGVSFCAALSFASVRYSSRWLSDLQRVGYGQLAMSAAAAIVCVWGEHSPDWAPSPLRFCAGFALLLGVTYPQTFVSLIALYSKLVAAAGGAQSVMIAYLQAAGAMGRVAGPIMSATLLEISADNISVGEYYLFLALTAMLVVCGATLVFGLSKGYSEALGGAGGAATEPLLRSVGSSVDGLERRRLQASVDGTVTSSLQ